MYSRIFFNLDSNVADYLPLRVSKEEEKSILFQVLHIFFVSQNNKILNGNRHFSTLFCILLKVKDLNGLPGYISVSLSLLKDFFTTSQQCCHYAHSILFHPLVNLMYSHVLSSRFGGLPTTPIWNHWNNLIVGTFWGFFPPSLEDNFFKVERN